MHDVTRLRRNAAHVLAVTMAMTVAPASMADELEICIPDVIEVPRLGAPTEGPTEQLPAVLEADEIESPDSDTLILRGDAQMERASQTVYADELIYHKQEDRAEARGNVVLYSPAGDRMKTSYAEIQLETLIGHAEASEFKLAHGGLKAPEPGTVFVSARGTAEKVWFEGHDVVRLEDGRVTRCVEGQDSVFVEADELILDQTTGVGLAKHVKLRFFGVPIFYFPRLSFSIDDRRKTGFLFPTLGSEGDSGFALGVPFYWNIAPDKDATFTARYLSDRGVQGAAEFRYLGSTYRGIFEGEFLPGDDEFGDDRAAARFEHDQDLSAKWDTLIDLQWVSDEDYLDDFSNNVQISSATHVPQNGRLNYRGNVWDFSARLSGYQTVDRRIPEQSRPYNRLPELTLSADPFEDYRGIDYGFDSELVNFDRDERIRGLRLDASPYLSYPVERLWGFIEPKVKLRYTSYSLSGVPEEFSDTPSRTIPITSLAGGIFLERDTSWLGEPFINTLEPEFFYLYIPEENQDEFPVFDTGEVSLNNFNNMFRDNRFFGPDRVGDANQLTLALTSRMIERDTGREWMRGRIGQIFFFKDREVQLFGEPDTESVSDTVGEVRAELTDSIDSTAFVQYNTEDSELRTARFDVRYQPHPRKELSLGYRFSKNSIEQTDLEARWPVSPAWQFNLRNRYSIEDSQNLETSVGLEYNACCWKFRIFGQRRVDNNEEYRNAVAIELEFVGLGSIQTGI